MRLQTQNSAITDSKQCDYRPKIVRLQTKQCDYRLKTVRLQAKNSAITAELLFWGTNQNAGITSDFKMDVINAVTVLDKPVLKHT